MSRVERIQLVTFALGHDHFAAAVAEIERVIRHRPPEPVPRMPEWMTGFVEHGGRSLPLVDLRLRFGLPPAPEGTEPRILVAGDGASRMGLVVDRVLDVAGVVSGELEPAPAIFRGLAGDYIQGTFRRGGQLVVVLRLARLLSAAERMVLLPAQVNS